MDTKNDMATLVETDEQVKLSDQLEENVGPIILINKFNVKSEEADQFLWVSDSTAHSLEGI
jgi:hypothetical protein